MIEEGKYFTINRARQFGKTTILNLLYRRLKTQYLVISLSFEATDEYFASLSAFAKGFSMDIAEAMKREAAEEKLIAEWEKPIDTEFPFKDVGRRITRLCENSEKGVILFIDEIDKSSDNQIFLTFLGLLRDKYLNREKGINDTFQSVILAGVHDIKNMKQKLRSDEEHKYNSPWNIAVPFDISMEFTMKDICGMLQEYKLEHNVTFDVEKISTEIFYYTSGYPFLVSRICQKMDDENREWKAESIPFVVRDLIQEKNTLFDDIIKNIYNNPQFADAAKKILIYGTRIAFDANNPVIDLGITFGIFINRNGSVAISNVIFETLILNYFTSLQDTGSLSTSQYAGREQYIDKGQLQMEYVMERFAEFLKQEYRNEDEDFIEQQGRLLFLCFLRPIINGTGHYAVEPQTRQNNRMDIQVFYGLEEFVIELKIWYGETYEAKGYDQLCDYLDIRGLQKGYILSFCRNKKKPWENRTFKYRGHEICEVIVAYREI